MTAFAVHPDYPLATDYDDILAVWLPAFEIVAPGDPWPWKWGRVLCLGWNRFPRKVWLGAGWSGEANSHFLVPKFREL